MSLEVGTNRNIESKFNKMLGFSIAIDIVFLGIGILFLCIPDFSTRLIGVLVGISFILYGANTAYKYFNRNGAKLYSLNLMFAIIAIVLGILLIVYPYTYISFIITCLGIYMIVIGALNINYGVWFKIGKDDSWLLTLVIGILLITFGIMVLTNPFSKLTFIQVVGFFLVVLSLLQITDTVLFKKKKDDIVKIFW
jgi:membrane protein HdeD